MKIAAGPGELVLASRGRAGEAGPGGLGPALGGWAAEARRGRFGTVALGRRDGSPCRALVLYIYSIKLIINYIVRSHFLFPASSSSSFGGSEQLVHGDMNAGELLGVEPPELKFPFELRKQISCSLQLSNKTDDHIAFKVKTTNPKKYCVRPNNGVVLPQSNTDIIVTMQAQREPPADIQCKDKFLVQSAVIDPATTAKDITAEMFSKESGNKVDEVKLKVVYISPPQPPSPVHEGSDEGSSPRASVSENSNVNASEPPVVEERAHFAHREEKHPDGTKIRFNTSCTSVIQRVHEDWWRNIKIEVKEFSPRGLTQPWKVAPDPLSDLTQHPRGSKNILRIQCHLERQRSRQSRLRDFFELSTVFKLIAKPQLFDGRPLGSLPQIL
ncbi:Vesicle-associated protein 1-2 [Platanthera guangdongensis]|uniref:Vesicle-associated protein 1-2 n=1 Tax=Platanthera guangdongensis TaxID=2320717 RepID=A0ABR2MI90_9ASPA